MLALALDWVVCMLVAAAFFGGEVVAVGSGVAQVNLLQALLRTFLIALVIPPLVFNPDQRGLHDLAVGTVTLRR